GAPEVLSVGPEDMLIEPPVVSVRLPVTVSVPAVTFSAPELVPPPAPIESVLLLVLLIVPELLRVPALTVLPASVRLSSELLRLNVPLTVRVCAPTARVAPFAALIVRVVMDTFTPSVTMYALAAPLLPPRSTVSPTAGIPFGLQLVIVVASQVPATGLFAVPPP